MKIVQITPGAGSMYCGNCFRDNALVTALRKMGHDAILVPLYLPLNLDEQDQSAGVPIFFGGINVYLDQYVPFYDRAPRFLRDWLSSPRMLKWATGKAAKTRPSDLGDMTLSMLRGEEGRQAVELQELVAWLQQQVKPDVICLSNAILIGLVRGLKSGVRAPVFCCLQGEDTFMDALPAAYKDRCWQTLAERAKEVDGFISPSRYFGDLMARRLSLRPDRVTVIYNGINLDGYEELQGSGGHPLPSDGRGAGGEGSSQLVHREAPVLGFFARMCPEKGLDTLIEAFITLKQRDRISGLTLRVGGSCGPADEPFVETLRNRLSGAGLLDHVTFHPNIERSAKIGFLRGLSALSVPARYGEAFGLYVIEAMAAGVPVVQPRHGAFTEVVEATGGGLLCKPDDHGSLAETTESLLLNPEKARALGESGRRSVFERFTSQAMAQSSLDLFERVIALGAPSAAAAAAVH